MKSHPTTLGTDVFPVQLPDLTLAVIRAYHQMDENKLHPGSEHWLSHPKSKAEIKDKVALWWGEVTGNHALAFPYNFHTVACGWRNYRKAQLDSRENMEAIALERLSK